MRIFLEIFLLFDYDRDSITEDVEVAMDIQHLKYFVEVVRQESFTRAAAQLFCDTAHADPFHQAAGGIAECSAH
ncbi:MAG: LysR family transcriptional regulator [Flavonifractor plautii]